ncbi:MAG: zinc ABC transporter substrate-binding protein [Proteobacteria bacterium]|nr:zinc ABC transporter substrate-binding protein [Pseudomonadota bacterium]
MLKKKWASLIVIAVCLLLQSTFFTFSYGEEKQNKIKIVATTSMIGSITKAIGEDQLEVVTIVPSGMCPGHFDICPKDAKLIEEAQVVLEHGFEGELFLDNMLRSNRNQDLKRLSLKVEGNLMVPEIHLQAVDEIAEFLGAIDPEHNDLFMLQAAMYKKKVNDLGKEIKQKLKKLNVKNIKVICSRMQAEFLEWLGFTAIASYGRQEELSPKDFLEITRIAKKENVKIVIDNLQSGSNVGKQLAEDIGGRDVVLTNFPLGDSYLESLKENVDKVIQACKWANSLR